MAYKTYKGRYKPRHPEKYVGDVKDIVYRSLWERNAFRWIDSNSSIVKWNSEGVIIPYLCETDSKVHRYFMDLWFVTEDSKTFIVEIKPKKSLYPPSVPKRKTPRYLSETLTYIKNKSKWDAARTYAQSRGWIFQIWTEDTLKSLGIKIIS